MSRALVGRSVIPGIVLKVSLIISVRSRSFPLGHSFLFKIFLLRIFIVFWELDLKTFCELSRRPTNQASRLVGTTRTDSKMIFCRHLLQDYHRSQELRLQSRLGMQFARTTCNVQSELFSFAHFFLFWTIQPNCELRHRD